MPVLGAFFGFFSIIADFGITHRLFMISTPNKETIRCLILYRHIGFENSFFYVNHHNIATRYGDEVKIHRRHGGHDRKQCILQIQLKTVNIVNTDWHYCGCQSILLRNPITLGKSIDEKKFILDIAVILNNYFRINLEMQVLDEHNWADRSMLYLCRCFTNIPKGSDYSEVHPAIHIGFLNFTPFPEEPEFYATNKMLNIKTHHLFNDKFTLSVIDLTQIHLATKEDRSFCIDHWASLFKATTWENIKMLADKNSDLNETAETLYQLNAKEDIRLQCQAREDYYMFKTMTENKMTQLEASLADKDATIADQKQVLAESLADIKKLQEEIRLLKSAQ